jgi:integrase/recombinase XerD
LNIFDGYYQRYLTLPLLGPIIKQVIEYAENQGYSHKRLIDFIETTKVLDIRLRAVGCTSLSSIDQTLLYKCTPPKGKSSNDTKVHALVSLLNKYFIDIGKWKTQEPKTIEYKYALEFTEYLIKVRGFSTNTIKSYRQTIVEFLSFFKRYDHTINLCNINIEIIESYIKHIYHRVSRVTLSIKLSIIKSFIKYLNIQNILSSKQIPLINYPLIYKDEKLPKAIPWNLVKSFLLSIDRSNPLGKRNYAIFQLIASYGLRCNEVVNLKLEDIHWRENRICVYQSKTTSHLDLPLINFVGESLLDYIINGRPETKHRNIFVRHHAPDRPLVHNSLYEIFIRQIKKSGLPIPLNGPHCLRHSLAIHLLQKQTPIKTISDILGHKNISSTFTYLRLNTEDLRGVALQFPWY